MTGRVFHPADAAASNDPERSLLEAVEACNTADLQDAAASYSGPSDGYLMTMKFVVEVYFDRCADDVDCHNRLLEHAFQMFFILCAAMARREGRKRVYCATMEKADDDDASVFDLVNKAAGKKRARKLQRWMLRWF